MNKTARVHYMLNFAFLGDSQRAEDGYERCRALFGDRWEDHALSLLRLSYRDTISRDEIVYSNPVWDAAKEHLDSPEAGLIELHRLYSDDNNLSENDIIDISILAAYFGDPEFAMDAMNKGHNINATGLFKIWGPVMKEVRQTARFKEFLREIGLVDYWNEFGWPDICHKLDNGDFECE